MDTTLYFETVTPDIVADAVASTRHRQTWKATQGFLRICNTWNGSQARRYVPMVMPWLHAHKPVSIEHFVLKFLTDESSPFSAVKLQACAEIFRQERGLDAYTAALAAAVFIFDNSWEAYLRECEAEQLLAQALPYEGFGEASHIVHAPSWMDRTQQIDFLALDDHESVRAGIQVKAKSFFTSPHIQRARQIAREANAKFVRQYRAPVFYVINEDIKRGILNLHRFMTPESILQAA